MRVYRTAQRSGRSSETSVVDARGRRYTNQYTAPTITAPPTMFPIVTGRRLSAKKLPQVSSERSGSWVETCDEALVALDQEPDRDEVHVRDRVLEAGRDEGRDRKDDRDDLVGRRVRSVRQPDGEADERVAQHPERDRLPKAEVVLVTAIESAVCPTSPPPNSY